MSLFFLFFLFRIFLFVSCLFLGNFQSSLIFSWKWSCLKYRKLRSSEILYSSKATDLCFRVFIKTKKHFSSIVLVPFGPGVCRMWSLASSCICKFYIYTYNSLLLPFLHSFPFFFGPGILLSSFLSLSLISRCFITRHSGTCNLSGFICLCCNVGVSLISRLIFCLYGSFVNWYASSGTTTLNTFVTVRIDL